MPEYDFPSGRLTTAFDPMDWIGEIQLLMAVVLVVSAAIAIWRWFRPATFTECACWGALLAAELLVIESFWQSYPETLRYIAPYRVWLLLVPVAAIIVSAFRAVPHWPGKFLVCVAAWMGLAVMQSVLNPHSMEPSFRTHCKNNLKQIGLAMHNHHDQHGPFAAAGNEATGFTWRIMLLPFLDQEYRPLFEEFHHNEPWNSPNNTTLQSKRPYQYQCPSHPTEKRFTSYAMLRGPGTVGGEGTAGVTIKQMTDGTSNTALVVEACGRAILWTEPKDVAAVGEALGVNLPGDQPGRSRGAISSYHHGGAHVLLADGTVRYVTDKIDPRVLRLLSTYDDGERVPEF